MMSIPKIEAKNSAFAGFPPSDMELYALCKLYGTNAKSWLRKFALLLPEVQRRALYKKKGFHSIHEFAAKLAGMRHGAVDEALRILDRVKDKPALRAVAEEFGFQRIRPVVTLATVATQDFWAEKARTMSKHALEVYVQNYRIKFRPGTELPFRKIKQSLSMELEEEVKVRLCRLKGDREWNVLIKELVEVYEERLSQTEIKKPEVVRATSRHIPRAIQRWTLQKTGGRCGYPGCVRPYHQLHHTQRWALEPVHDPDRIVPLCRAHNELAHHTLIDNEEASPAEWKMRKMPNSKHPKYRIDRRVVEYFAPS